MTEEVHPLFGAFRELAALLTNYGLQPNDYFWGSGEKLYPELTLTWERALSLYDDQTAGLTVDENLIELEEFFCENKSGEEKAQFIKQFRMSTALANYMYLHQGDILSPQRWNNSPIVTRYPEVINLLDKDQLFDIAYASSFDDGKIQYKSDLLFYHPKLSHHFLRHFALFCHKHKNCEKKIALDSRRILHPSKYATHLLEDYWYGPKFTIETIDEPLYGLNFTVHIRPPDSKYNLFGFKLHRTEFMWSMRKNRKTLQIEELVPAKENPYSSRVVVRYLHSIRDVETHAFIHLDGAVRWYSPENYAKRFNSELRDHIEADGYVKLFRVDGSIPNQDWIELIANFFSGNELIHEYFGQPK